jgi:hypothetical protein
LRVCVLEYVYIVYVCVCACVYARETERERARERESKRARERELIRIGTVFHDGRANGCVRKSAPMSMIHVRAKCGFMHAYIETARSVLKAPNALGARPLSPGVRVPWHIQGLSIVFGVLRVVYVLKNILHRVSPRRQQRSLVEVSACRLYFALAFYRAECVVCRVFC